MPASHRAALVAALKLLALELRQEQGADHPHSLVEARLTAARHARTLARGKAWKGYAHPAAPEPAPLDNGTIAIVIGRTRYAMPACFTVIERFAKSVGSLPAALWTAPGGFQIDRLPAPVDTAALPAPQPVPTPVPTPAPWPDPAAPEPAPWPDPASEPAPWPDPAAPTPGPWPAPEIDRAAARSAAARKAMANRDRFAAAAKAAATRAARRAPPVPPPPPPPVTPAFADWVSDRIGTRRWIIGPARRGERQLVDKVIDPAWHAELRAAFRLAARA